MRCTKPKFQKSSKFDVEYDIPFFKTLPTKDLLKTWDPKKITVPEQESLKPIMQARLKQRVSNMRLSNLMKFDEQNKMVDFFLALKDADQVDKVSYTTMIANAVKKNDVKMALYFYSEMRRKYEPTSHTYSLLFKLFANDQSKRDLLLDDLKSSKMPFDTVLLRQLVHMYGKCGEHKQIMPFFINTEQCPPDYENCSFMLHYCCQKSDVENALKIVEFLVHKQKTISTLMMTKLTHLMRNTGRHDSLKILYQKFIAAKELNEHLLADIMTTFKDDIPFLEQIWKDVHEIKFKPKLIHYNILLGAFAKIPNVEAAERIYQIMNKEFVGCDIVTYNTMLGMYSRTDSAKFQSLWKQVRKQATAVSYSFAVSFAWDQNNIPRLKQLQQEMKELKIQPLPKTAAIFDKALKTNRSSGSTPNPIAVRDTAVPQQEAHTQQSLQEEEREPEEKKEEAFMMRQVLPFQPAILQHPLSRDQAFKFLPVLPQYPYLMHLFCLHTFDQPLSIK